MDEGSQHEAASATHSGVMAISLKARGLAALPDRPPPPLSSQQHQQHDAGQAAPAVAAAAARRAARAAGEQLLSLFCALAIAAVALPPWAWLSAVLTSVATVFFVASQSAALTDGLVAAFYLAAAATALQSAYLAVARRDRGAELLARAKAALGALGELARASLPLSVRARSGMVSSGGGGYNDGRAEVEAADALKAAGVELMDALHAYLGGPERPNTEAFSAAALARASAPGPRLYQLSIEIGARLRRVQACTLAVSGLAAAIASSASGGGGAAGAAAAAGELHRQANELRLAVEQLSALKEQRTPLLLRATARSYVVLVSPIVLGSALAGVARGAPGAHAAAVAWAVAVGCMLQLLLAGVLAVAVALEDPFASPHPDALSVWEARDGAAYMLYGGAGAGGANPRGPAAAAAVGGGGVVAGGRAGAGAVVGGGGGAGNGAAAPYSAARVMPPMPPLA